MGFENVTVLRYPPLYYAVDAQTVFSFQLQIKAKNSIRSPATVILGISRTRGNRCDIWRFFFRIENIMLLYSQIELYPSSIHLTMISLQREQSIQRLELNFIIQNDYKCVSPDLILHGTIVPGYFFVCGGS